MVEDAFAGETAFAVRVGRGERREWALGDLRKVGVEFEQWRGVVVGDVVDLAGGGIWIAEDCVDEGEEGLGCIVAVDLINDAGTIGVDGGGAVEKFLNERPTSGTVEAGETGDSAVMGKDKVFGGS